MCSVPCIDSCEYVKDVAVRCVLNFVWAHLQLQSDVRKMTSVFLARVLDVIEHFISSKHMCLKAYEHGIAGILWTALHAIAVA